MMFLEVTAQSKPRPHHVVGSYGRISAKCNGEKVYIASTSVHECRIHKAALIALAWRHHLPMLKIHNLLHAAALAHADTQPVNLDEDRFEFPWTKPWELGPVPDPDDNVDALEASAACLRDAQVCTKVLEKRSATLRQLFAILDNQRQWLEYFVVRDTNPSRRRRIAAALAEHERIAEQNFEKLQQILNRRLANNGNGQAH